jgi:hypothetical protein
MSVALDRQDDVFTPSQGYGSSGFQFWRTPSTSTAVVPGEAATPQALKHEEERQALVALLARLSVSGLSWTADRSATITAASRQTAQAILRALPAGKALPKISPDAEGGLMMVWNGPGDPFLLTVDNLRLHAVLAATTPRAVYLDDIPFWGQELTQQLLDAIPSR